MMTTEIFGVQTVGDLMRWLIPTDQQAAFTALEPWRQLFRLADYAHAKRQYQVRDVCNAKARALRPA